jgi:hypothetical protein
LETHLRRAFITAFLGALCALTISAASFGGLTKQGTGTVSSNSYTGSTTDNAGTLRLISASLADTARLSITAGAFLNLTHTSADRVSALALGGVSQPHGRYGEIGSADPTDIESPCITGTGQITGGPPTAYQQRAQDHNLSGANVALTANPDGDDANNLEEFAFSGDPNSAADIGLFRQIC